MNSKLKVEENENKSMIAQLRAIRDKISLEIMDLNKDQIKAYFKRKKSLFSKRVKLHNPKK
jgi:hypothetical protein